MKRQLFLRLFFLAVLTVLAIVAIWILTVPQYRANGEVRVRPIIPRLVFKTENNGLIPFYNSYVNTQASIIRSQTILQRVLDQREVQETQWYKNPSKSVLQRLGGKKVSPLDRIGDDLSVQPRPSTEIIDISFIAKKPEDARVIVDNVLENYLRYTGEMTNDTEDKLYQQLVDQYNVLETEIHGREAVIAQLRRSFGILNPNELLSSKRRYIEETQNNLNRVEHNIALLEWKIKKSDNIDSNEPVVDDSGKIKFQLEQAKFQEQLLQAELEKKRRDFNDFFIKTQLFEKESSELNTKRKLFEAVRLRREQKDIERNVPGTIEVLTGAFVSSKPYKDHRILFTIIALVLWFSISSSFIVLFRIRTEKFKQD